MLLKEPKEEEEEAERIRSELGSSKGLMQEREKRRMVEKKVVPS